jgi:TonB family protein
VDRAFSGVGGLTVAGRGGAGGAGLRGKGSGGSGKAVGIGDLGARVGGPGSVGTGKMVKERVPKAIVKQRQAEIDGTMNPDATYRILRRGMRCITATYQRSLKRNPKLSGKVSVCLSVNTMGRVASVSMEEDSIGDPMLTAGVKACVKRLRFPPPEGGSAEVCVPFVLQPSQMYPNRLKIQHKLKSRAGSSPSSRPGRRSGSRVGGGPAPRRGPGPGRARDALIGAKCEQFYGIDSARRRSFLLSERRVNCFFF